MGKLQTPKIMLLVSVFIIGFVVLILHNMEMINLHSIITTEEIERRLEYNQTMNRNASQDILRNEENFTDDQVGKEVKQWMLQYNETMLREHLRDTFTKYATRLDRIKVSTDN